MPEEEKKFSEENVSLPEESADSDIVEEKKRKRKSRIFWIIIFIVVNGSVIAYTAVDEFSKERPSLGYDFMFSNFMFIIAGFGCMLLALFIETLKYLTMMKDLGEKVSVSAAFETAALGKYFDNITPSGAGGQPFQIYNMHLHGYSKGVSAAMPLAGFLFMQLAFVFLALLTFIFQWNVVDTPAIHIPALIGVVCYSIVPFIIILSAFSEKTARGIVFFFVRIGARLHLVKNLDNTLDSLGDTLHDYCTNLRLIATKKKLMIKLSIYSIIYQLAICSIPFFVLHAYRGTGSWLHITAQTIFIYAAITIVPTPGNSGAAEGSFYLIFSQLEYAGLFWGMLIWRFICYYSFIIIGVGIYAFKALKKQLEYRKKKKTSDP